jgi:hypothetical protein
VLVVVAVAEVVVVLVVVVVNSLTVSLHVAVLFALADCSGQLVDSQHSCQQLTALCWLLDECSAAQRKRVGFIVQHAGHSMKSSH